MEVDGHIGSVALEEKAHLLISSIQAGDVDHAMRQLLAFNDGRNSNFYRQIGKITRGLHSAIGNLEIRNNDVGDHQRDVHERLSYVIDLTADAANRTMDLAEEALPVSNALRDESARLAVDWEKLGNRELTAEDFRALYVEMSNFLSYATIESARLHVGFTEIVLAQSYQDLSGQILQKVMTMLQNTQEELVSLLALAGKAEEQGCGIDAGEAVPQISAETIVHDRDIVAEGPLPDSAGSLKNQDEVDELLLSYGF
jgi:chemotaxis protein CheZ